jgi:hypothetical protein
LPVKLYSLNSLFFIFKLSICFHLHGTSSRLGDFVSSLHHHLRE